MGKGTAGNKGSKKERKTAIVGGVPILSLWRIWVRRPVNGYLGCA